MKKISFIIDGYFGLTLYKNIKHVHNKSINFSGLVNATCKALQHSISETCVSPANLRQYYIGTNIDQTDVDRNEYENALMLSRFGARGRPLRNGREKCIDTMLFSDVKEGAQSGAFDYLVLMAGDMDHLTLVQDLENLGIKTILLYGEICTNGRKTTGCSPELKTACFKAVNIFDLLGNVEIFLDQDNGNDSFEASMGGMNSNESNSRRFTPQNSMTNVRPSPFAFTRHQTLSTHNLLASVVFAVNEVIREKEQREGRHLAFAFQAQVGSKLKNIGVVVPGRLSEFLDAHPDVFRTGYHPVTNAETVSLRTAC